MLKTIHDPNFTIILPGGCNANCPFCFWKATDNPVGWPGVYEKLVFKVLDKLPKWFQQISLSGGEPTLSPFCDLALDLIDKKRFPKVVLSTNGTKASIFGLKNLRKINHVNISRHAILDEANYRIFRSYAVPSTGELKVICDGLNRLGIDVCLSVVMYKFKKEDVRPFIAYAKGLGASSICFRKIHSPTSTLDPSPAEKAFSCYSPIYTSGCPACRSMTNIIDGMTVVWKTSVYEPTSVMKEVYELILHEDCRLTMDWAGSWPVKLIRGGLDGTL